MYQVLTLGITTQEGRRNPPVRLRNNCAGARKGSDRPRNCVPHMLRIAIGADHRLLVPGAALVGGAFLVVCDTVARTALGGRELPVGAVTAMVGGPLFLWLLRRNHHRVLAP